MDDFRPIVHKQTQSERQWIRKSQQKFQLANFTDFDHVLVAREDLFEYEKL